MKFAIAGALTVMAAVVPQAGVVAADAGDQVVFEGASLFSRRELLGALRRYSVQLEGNFGRTEVDDAAYFLREFYFSRGFRAAEVGYSFTSPPPRAVFTIDEGGRTMIGRVEFVGGDALPTERLHDIFSAAVRVATLQPLGRMRYVDSAVEAARQEIVRAFQLAGYLAAVATVSESEAAGNLRDIRIEIDAGVRYVLRNVEFENSPVPIAELDAVVASQIGQPYVRNEELLLGSRIEEFLKNRGYLEASVREVARIDTQSGSVGLTVNVTAGPIFQVGTIRVQGNVQTAEAAVLARFGVKPGTTYDASKVDEGARRLWFSGAFAEAEVERVPRADGTVDLLVNLEETRAKRIQFNLAYSQWERGLAEVHYIDRNFLGTLNRFSIDAGVSLRGYGIYGSLANPWFFGTDATGSIGGFLSRRELPAYRSTEVGTTLSLERSYNASTLTGYRVQYGWKRVSDSEIFGEEEGRPFDPDYTLGSVSVAQTYDTRNDILSPMKGALLRHEMEAASPGLLGELSFFRFDAQMTYYLPLREITTERPFVPFVVLNHRAGLLVPYAGTDVVPVQERFFLGGPNTVRSYQLDGLGPKDNDGVPLGGLAMLLANVEIQWPVFNNIYVAAFTDGGNLASTFGEFDLDETQFAAGPGLRVYTPIGAVRVDYGYNLNPDPGDPVGNWQFGFGFTF